MATPQEARFLRLAIATKVLTRQQAQACLSLQARKRRGGSKLPIWDCAVLQNLLEQDAAEKLQAQAGDLDREKLGDYTILRKLGEGGMGSVWQAVGPDKQRVAIKLLAPHLVRQRSLLTRFFREAQAAIRLQHEHIVRGLAVAEDEGYYFFAMEFVDGKSVREIMEESGPLDPTRATEVIAQVADALAYAHENGIIHRDIKPDNIMLTRAGVAKLADLGLARQVDAEMTALTRTGTAMGTPYYMAPEQANDAKRADARSDIYSLGATWYHMITGKVPFDGSTPLEIWHKHLKEPIKPPATLQPGVPRNVSLLIERMMSKEPGNRVQTAREVCDIIHERCMGKRNIADELGLNQPKVQETLWDMLLPIGGRQEKRRLALSEVRVRIRKGQIKRDTPTRRAGSREEYQPAVAFLDLQREFPRSYAAPTQMAVPKEEPASRAKLHDLVTHFDDANRAYRRKGAFKKWSMAALEVFVVLAVLFTVWQFWPQIRGMVAGSQPEVAEEAPPPGP